MYRKLFVPTLADLLFVALLLAAFGRAGGWQDLLADGDTGWHIRTGELILATGRVPAIDPFSFSRAGAPWIAWEWLSDVAFALAARRGLIGAAVLAGVAVCAAASVLFGWLLRRGAGLWIALAATLAAVSASSVHYLARPHVFSILLYTVSLWILDEDRRRRRALVWLLPAIAALWANLHGAFLMLPATLVLAAAVDGVRRRARDAARYASLAVACLAATCLNPYGWQLHRHILTYVRAPWILDHVQEFQSPNIRSEGMLVFAVLLLAAAALASRAMAHGEWFAPVLALVWGLAALRSARHIPLFAVAAAPVIAGECARWWQARADVVWDLGRDLGRWRPSVWLPALAGLALTIAPHLASAGFPPARFPVAAVERHASVLAPDGRMPRILTSDQWADYLIYRLYPGQRVYFDGRSDFYGPELGQDYRVLLSASAGWRELVGRNRFQIALLPRDWPLSTILDREPNWVRLDEDAVSVLFVERELR
jgi:hypothetical protein